MSLLPTPDKPNHRFPLEQTTKPTYMQKYYYNDGVDRFGPFTIEELQAKNISPATPVWYDGLPNWTPAGELEELKSIFSGAAAVTEQAGQTVQQVTEEVKTPEPAPVETKAAGTASVTVQAEPVPAPAPAPAPAAVQATAGSTTTTETPAPKPAPAPAPAAASPKPARKKGNPVITYVLSLLVLGGAGYYVYQDMEKHKSSEPVTMNTTTTEETSPAKENNAPTDNASNPATENNNATTENAASNESNNANVPPADLKEEKTTPASNTTSATDKGKTTTTLTPPSKNQADLKKQQEKEKQAIADAKKKAAADAKKEEDRKKAQALKETEMRNNWPRYVTIGSFTVEGDDRVNPFNIPVNNGFPVMVDKVTIRVDYLKKEKKVVGSETLVLNNIPGRSNQSVQAAGNKKAKTANVYITGVTSRQLHFCYPVNNGNAADPYYCN